MNAPQYASTFPGVLQRFFCDRLIDQQNASLQTVASYRDTFRLLLSYVQDQTSRSASNIGFSDLNVSTILGFLGYLEKNRGNKVGTRNLRLAAIRSFVRYAATEGPVFLTAAQRILAIPMKRTEHPLVGFLSREEVQAILDAADPSTWSGRRDRALLTTAYNTGARVSEMISVRNMDLSLQRSPFLRIRGKGRKERVVPLWKSTVRLLKQWSRDIDASDDSPLFPNRQGLPLSRSGVEDRLRRLVKTASGSCPSLLKQNISPHTLRHTTAMHMLQSGVDFTVISLWLGHESPSTTHIYVEADLAMKEKALSTLHPPRGTPRTYKTSDKLLAFLERL